MAIQVLDQDTINKIAAGEVVERPSSVVKELVENAIDAGATAITVEIRDGGISLIRITDNGSGIEGSEIKTAFLRHSTSKIKSVEDLLNVSSLGFRGEALSSIASVAQIELITKTADSFTGFRYVIEGGREVSLEEVGVPDGTTFIVRNLFYNTPARRKFLKSPQTEAGYIASLVEHLALSHPDISFRFINNNQNKLHTSGNLNLKDIIYNVYGRDITNNLVEINAKTQDIEITGFIGRPMISRGNRTYENYYINGRYIKSSIITKAIEEAYKGYIMPHNYPFTALHFTINPQILDVNVHPTKMELRFAKNDMVYNFVFDTIKDALKKIDLAVAVELEEAKAVSFNPRRENYVPVRENVAVKSNTKSDDGVKQDVEVQSEEKINVPYKAPTVKPLASAVEIGKTESFNKKTDETPTIKAHTTNYAAITTDKTRLPEPFEVKRSQEMIKEDVVAYTAKKEEAAKQMSMFEDPLIQADNTEENYRVIGQLFETYWLMEYNDKFYMMDQHAAHEKILYEKFMKRFRESGMDTQMIMPPVVLELNMQQENVYKENKDVFANAGYEIEHFGGNAYKVTGIPASLPSIDCKQLLIDMIDGMMDDHKGDYDILTEKVASMSCKAAVKGNNKLSFDEARELMQELMKADNPYNCPHGRPTLIMMSKYEIEKKFKRII